MQQLFINPLTINALLMTGAVLLFDWLIGQLPSIPARPEATIALSYAPVSLSAPPGSPLKIAGAWVVEGDDPRFGGFSALVVDRGAFVAISDLGAVARFDPPTATNPHASIADLAVGPGPFGKKENRDAESLVRSSAGDGWWVGYEQSHSIWRYRADFRSVSGSIAVKHPGWGDNRGVEAMVDDGRRLILFGEGGRDVIVVGQKGQQRLPMTSDWRIADAARAPDGSIWALLRRNRIDGIHQAIAPVMEGVDEWAVGSAVPLPKDRLDNYEGMVILPQAGGGWRIWLISDDGHRIMARTLLVALDWHAPNAKRPAQGPGAVVTAKAEKR